MNKNSLYRDLTSLGTKYELNLKMNDAVKDIYNFVYNDLLFFILIKILCLHNVL